MSSGATPCLRKAAEKIRCEVAAATLGLMWQRNSLRSTACSSWSALTSASRRATSSVTTARSVGGGVKDTWVSILPGWGFCRGGLSHFKFCISFSGALGTCKILEQAYWELTELCFHLKSEFRAIWSHLLCWGHGCAGKPCPCVKWLRKDLNPLVPRPPLSAAVPADELQKGVIELLQASSVLRRFTGQWLCQSTQTLERGTVGRKHRKIAEAQYVARSTCDQCPHKELTPAKLPGQLPPDSPTSP